MFQQTIFDAPRKILTKPNIVYQSKSFRITKTNFNNPYHKDLFLKHRRVTRRV